MNPEYLLAGDFDGDNKDEIMAGFGTLGLWLCKEGAWSLISAKNPEWSNFRSLDKDWGRALSSSAKMSPQLPC